MKKSELILTASLVPLDAILLFLAGLTAYGMRFTNTAVGIRRVMFYLPVHDFARSLGIVVATWLVIFAANGLYEVDPNNKFANELNKIFFACTAGLAAITVYIFFRGDFFSSRFIVLAGWAIAIIYLALGRLLMRIIKWLLYRKGIATHRVVLIGSGIVTDRLSELFSSHKGLGYTVIARYPIFNGKVRSEILDLDAKSEVDEILLTTPHASREETLTILTFAEEHQFAFKYSADLFSTLAPNMRMSTLGDIPVIDFCRTRLDGWGKIYKRIFDLISSFILIVLASPVMALAALAIIIEDGKPVLFKNTRVGFRGRTFKTLKFRSMYVKYCTEGESLNDDALHFEEQLIREQNTKDGPIYKIARDPRITKVGHFIRRWSIDELPQLFNVLLGHMSLVGPRPHQPREVAKYSPEDRRVHMVKPGLTGLAQISGRSDLSFEDEIRLDMFYIENWSLTMDLFILLKTVPAVFRRRKAE